MHYTSYFSIFFTLFLSLPILSAHHDDGSAEKIPSIREAHLLIEQQKVLSQQSAKAFLGLAINKKVPEFYIELDSARILFEQHMRQIDAFVPNTPLQIYADRIRQAWAKFGTQLRKEIDKEEAEILLSLNDELLNACQAFSDELEKFKNSLLPNVAASLKKMDAMTLQAFDQSILAQEYLLYFFADKLGVSNKSIAKRIATIQKDFYKQLAILSDAEENSADVDAGLHHVKAQIDELNEMLKKWDASNVNYLSGLAIHVRWASGKMEEVAYQYNEIAEVLSISHLINLSSIHRAHTQELAKMYTGVSYQLINTATGKKNLQNSIATFEARFNRLQLFAPTEETRNAISTVERFWKNYKNLLISDFTEDNILKIIEQSHILMAACDKISEEVINYSETLPTYAKVQGTAANERAGRLVNLSGRQCMDLQRIPIYFILVCKDLGGAATRNRFEESKIQFENTLHELEEVLINSKEIEAKLVTVNELWAALQGTIGTINNQDVTRMTQTMQKADELYILMLEVNGLYAKFMNETIEQKIKKR